MMQIKPTIRTSAAACIAAMPITSFAHFNGGIPHQHEITIVAIVAGIVIATVATSALYSKLATKKIKLQKEQD